MQKPLPLCRRIERKTVARVVRGFYQRVRSEPGLSGYFTHIDDWPQHESHIADFWWRLMGGEVEAPRPRAMELGHRDLVFGQSELTLWLMLFEKTLQEELAKDIANDWSTLAQELGRMMTRRDMLIAVNDSCSNKRQPRN